jgi:hypothetical protein
MSRITTRLLRWSAISALMLSTVASVGLAQAADADTQTAEVAGASITAAAPTGSAAEASSQPQRAASCSFSSPCQVSRTSDGRMLDYGGPGLYFERSSAD